MPLTGTEDMTSCSSYRSVPGDAHNDRRAASRCAYCADVTADTGDPGGSAAGVIWRDGRCGRGRRHLRRHPFSPSRVSERLSIDIGTTGLLSTAQVGSFALASFFAGRLFRPRRRLHYGALGIVAVATAASAFTTAFPSASRHPRARRSGHGDDHLDRLGRCDPVPPWPGRCRGRCPGHRRRGLADLRLDHGDRRLPLGVRVSVGGRGPRHSALGRFR